MNNKNKEYLILDSSMYRCEYIVSFCIKYKRKIITDFMKKDLINIFNEISEKYNFKINDLTIDENRVILKINCSNPRIDIYNVIVKLKNGSAKKLKELYPELKTRIPAIWTRESFIATIGSVEMTDIENFFNNQKKY